jgi:zinc transport system substrate-binding protein
MKNKRIFLIIIACLLIFTLALTGCVKEQANENTDENNQNTPGQEQTSPAKKILIYTTLYPLYDFAKQVGGELVEVRSIVPLDAEPHDFEPSAKDIADANSAQIFVYNGAGYETWIKKIAENIDSTKTLVVEASHGIKLLKAEEHDDHGQEEEGHTDEHANEETDENGHEVGEYDPHVWLDPMRAKQQANNILAALVQVDPANKDTYQANFDRFAAELDTLDAEYSETIGKAQKKEFVVAHAAYGYIADRYNIEQIPVTGLSPSDEPSQKELQELIEIVKEHNINYVAFEQLVVSKVAQTVQRETGAEAVTLSNLENATKEQFNAGKTYIQLMLDNLEILKKVLEVK